MNRREFFLTTAGGVIAASNASLALAEPARDVVVGAVYPLSGSSAGIGVEARHAIETAVDIINNPHDIDLPLAKSSGLPDLGGAKIKVLFADHQGDPEKGRAEAERLMTQENVCTLIGAYHSAVSATVSATAERYSIPYIAADSSSPSLSRRGLKFFFRPSATDEMFSKAMFDFLDELRGKGTKIESLALFHEDTIYGTDSAKAQAALAKERGYKIVVDVKYHANSPSLTAEVQQLKSANASVLMPSSYTTDAILLVKTMAELGYKPSAILAQAAGFSDQMLYQAVGSELNGSISRASFSLDLGSKRPSVLAVNTLYKARSGIDLDDNSSRQLMGMIVAADAINRAKSVDGKKIRDALAATNISGDQTIMPWSRVKFDAAGQNPDANPVLLQYISSSFKTVFPDQVAVAKPVWPMNA